MGDAVWRYGQKMAHLHGFHSVIEIVVLYQRQAGESLRCIPAPAQYRFNVIGGRYPGIGLLLGAQTTIKDVVGAIAAQRLAKTQCRHYLMRAAARQPEVKLIDAIVTVHHLAGMFGDAGIQAIKHGHDARQMCVSKGNFYLRVRLKGDKNILIALALPREMYRLFLFALNV